ncbi:MAG: hypothetical protein LBE08_04260, partial [Bifidobacteriaceae bacterium]|nr:hypothetical protein [Bifidobacteriaceae bacterium]
MTSPMGRDSVSPPGQNLSTPAGGSASAEWAATAAALTAEAWFAGSAATAADAPTPQRGIPRLPMPDPVSPAQPGTARLPDAVSPAQPATPRLPDAVSPAQPGTPRLPMPDAVSPAQPATPHSPVAGPSAAGAARGGGDPAAAVGGGPAGGAQGAADFASARLAELRQELAPGRRPSLARPTDGDAYGLTPADAAEARAAAVLGPAGAGRPGLSARPEARLAAPTVSREQLAAERATPELWLSRDQGSPTAGGGAGAGASPSDTLGPGDSLPATPPERTAGPGGTDGIRQGGLADGAGLTGRRRRDLYPASHSRATVIDGDALAGAAAGAESPDSRRPGAAGRPGRRQAPDNPATGGGRSLGAAAQATSGARSAGEAAVSGELRALDAAGLAPTTGSRDVVGGLAGRRTAGPGVARGSALPVVPLTGSARSWAEAREEAPAQAMPLDAPPARYPSSRSLAGDYPSSRSQLRLAREQQRSAQIAAAVAESRARDAVSPAPGTPPTGSPAASAAPAGAPALGAPTGTPGSPNAAGAAAAPGAAGPYMPSAGPGPAGPGPAGAGIPVANPPAPAPSYSVSAGQTPIMGAGYPLAPGQAPAVGAPYPQVAGQAPATAGQLPAEMTPAAFIAAGYPPPVRRVPGVVSSSETDYPGAGPDGGQTESGAGGTEEPLVPAAPSYPDSDPMAGMWGAADEMRPVGRSLTEEQPAEPDYDQSWGTLQRPRSITVRPPAQAQAQVDITGTLGAIAPVEVPIAQIGEGVARPAPLAAQPLRVSALRAAQAGGPGRSAVPDGWEDAAEFPVATPAAAQQLPPPGMAQQFAPPGTAQQTAPPGMAQQFAPPGTAQQTAPPGMAQQFAPPGTAQQTAPPGIGQQGTMSQQPAQFSRSQPGSPGLDGPPPPFAPILPAPGSPGPVNAADPASPDPAVPAVSFAWAPEIGAPDYAAILAPTPPFESGTSPNGGATLAAATGGGGTPSDGGNALAGEIGPAAGATAGGD